MYRPAGSMSQRPRCLELTHHAPRQSYLLLSRNINYSLRIHMISNVLWYVYLQSIIIFTHIIDFFLDYPAFDKQQQIPKRCHARRSLLFPSKWNTITLAVRWIQGPAVKVLFPYPSVKLHLFVIISEKENCQINPHRQSQWLKVQCTTLSVCQRLEYFF